MRNFTELDAYLFGQATHYDIYQKMGVHKATVDGVDGYFFDVWAPHAVSVSVIGEFNDWDEERHYMEHLTPAEMGILSASYCHLFSGLLTTM